MNDLGIRWWDGDACACVWRDLGWSLRLEALPELIYLIHFA
jgi:hypothetical protein